MSAAVRPGNAASAFERCATSWSYVPSPLGPPVADTLRLRDVIGSQSFSSP